MGKLHSLRRKIERSPEEFLGKEKFYTSGRLVLGAIKGKFGWKPIRWRKYSKFVMSVLKKLGYENIWTW